jgi:cation:H+ antiporter
MLTGSIKIAKKFGLSPLVIGSTIVGFGTALPTIAVNLVIVFSKNPQYDIAIGNMIGTNYVNLGLALGIPAVITTIVTKYNVFEKEIPLYLALIALLTSFAANMSISRIEGLIVFIAYIAITIVIYQYANREKAEKSSHNEFNIKNGEKNIGNISITKNISFIILGLVVLTISALLLNYSAPKFASSIGISDYIVGLTLVGVGTSIPTIVASIQSARQGYLDIVLGNVFGGNIVNTGLGIGFIALFKVLPISNEAISDINFTNIYNMVILIEILIEMKLLGKNKALSQMGGLVIVITYISYIIFKIVSQ